MFMNKIAKCITASFLCFILMSTFTVRSYAYGKCDKVYRKGQDSNMRIALTFDDGPHPRYTKMILDILNEYEITATFFVIGKNIENYPESMKLISDAGCEIGNHTYTHARLDRLSQEQIEDEISRCETLIVSVTGKHSKVIRPPHGFISDELIAVSQKMDYDTVLWSIDTEDWALTPSIDIYKSVLGNINSGDIILMHDYVSGGNTTCGALRKIIPELLDRGYEFVTVSELLNCE